MSIEVKQMVIQSKINTSEKPKSAKEVPPPSLFGCADAVREFRNLLVKTRGEIRER